MKYFAVVLVLALVALSESKPLEAESIEPGRAEVINGDVEATPRDKRGLLVGAAYTAPVAYSAYSAYTAPVAYTSAYSYPYTYPYSAYPYYAATYSAPYIVA
ncbi:uncharacterized protein LOC105698551 [Orussus abietinus]|uniref:uncharacterized protein LOC105698551 n=1 Tax=Orussus abietinus TaxID=222816 RepID=UPI00062663AE|nr:uncharacterized protein LOC105698551 [Orussus abietinus]